MTKTIRFSWIFVALCSTALLTQGCKDNHNHGLAPQAQGKSAADAHAALHQTKYNETLVEFPGHRYAMEITGDEATGKVSAFLTDAHFVPVEVDTREVKLNFIIDGQPKTFTLPRAEQVKGEPATFTLTNKDLATLNCGGWQNEATATIEIDGKPLIAKLQKIGEHKHDGHAGHSH